MSKPLFPAALLLALPLLSACGEPDTAPAAAALAADAGVVVADVWCRETGPGARVGACYLSLTSGTADRFTAFTTPSAARPEIHTMSTEGGVMRMRPLPDGLALPAGETVVLRPGAEHLMLIDLAQPLRAGDSIPLTLTFETAPALTVNAEVRQMAAAAAHGGGHGH